MTQQCFDDSTTVSILLAAIAPHIKQLLKRDEITVGQECFVAVCEFARLYPDSQTAADLLAWAHGQTPACCVETARAETLQEWIAPQDMAIYEALGH